MDESESDVALQLKNRKPSSDYESKKPSQKSSTWKHFQEFSENTSLHGVKYVGENDRTRLERIFWSMMFFISFMICTYLISKVWYKWNTSPVIVSFAKTSTPISEIPFPAITVCPETKSRRRIFDFKKVFKNEINRTDEEEKHLHDLEILCIPGSLGEFTINMSSVNFLQNVAPQLKETIDICELFSRYTPCEFKPILTEEGVCYTFNMIDDNFFESDNMPGEMKQKNVNDGKPMWTLDNGYSPDAPYDAKPVRAYGAGYRNKFTFEMYANDNDIDYFCRGITQGFRVFLHNPAESPRIGLHFFYVPLDQEVIAAVKPEMMTTSSVLRDYTSEHRQCYFPDERKLLFHKVYTQINCQQECIANFTLKQCKCVTFYMPRNNTTPICGSGSKHCLSAMSSTSTIQIVNKSSEHYCNCLPACTSLKYNVETSQGNLNWKLTWYNDIKYYKMPGLRVSKVAIFFKEMQFITSHRSELYGLTDFLANCGGLLGLALGFSILSLIEIVYFLTIRPLCNLGRKGHKRFQTVICTKNET